MPNLKFNFQTHSNCIPPIDINKSQLFSLTNCRKKRQFFPGFSPVSFYFITPPQSQLKPLSLCVDTERKLDYNYDDKGSFENIFG